MSERARRRQLGRGLAALFGEAEGDAAADPATQRQVPIELIRPGAFQPRRRFAEAELDALAQSIREKGILQPLLVRPLAGEEAAFELVAGERREFLLSRAIRSRVGNYDDVLIDCPPSLNLLTINALVAADSVLVPLQCEFYALEGLSQLVRTIERVQRALNPRLDLQGVVLTMYDQRNNLCDLVAADVRAHFGAKVFNTMIPRNVRIAEAPSHGKPVLIYDHGCAGAQAYIRLAAEILRRTEGAAR